MPSRLECQWPAAPSVVQLRPLPAERSASAGRGRDLLEMLGRGPLARAFLGLSVVEQCFVEEQPEDEVGLARLPARVPLRWDARAVDHVGRVHVQDVAAAGFDVNVVLREGEQQFGIAELREQAAEVEVDRWR